MAPRQRQKSTRRLVLLALVPVALVLVVTIGSVLLGPRVTSPAPPLPPSGQAVFAENLENDQESLDRGVLAYTDAGTLDAGAQSTFTVMITDIGKHPFAVFPLVPFPGWVVDRQDVPTGGILSVTATCDDVKLKCKPESPARLAVLAAPNAGNWTWELSALSPGPARMTLTVTTYDQNSQIVLNEAAPIEITIPVRATTSYRLKALAGTAGGLIRWIGPALLFAGAAATWGWYRKRRKKAPANAAPASSDLPGDAGQSHPQQSLTDAD